MRAFVFSCFVCIGALIATGGISAHGGGRPSAFAGATADKVEPAAARPTKYVVHHLAGAINSGMVGTDFQRFFDISGKRLTLKPPATKNGRGEDVQIAIPWERLSD